VGGSRHKTRYRRVGEAGCDIFARPHRRNAFRVAPARRRGNVCERNQRACSRLSCFTQGVQFTCKNPYSSDRHGRYRALAALFLTCSRTRSLRTLHYSGGCAMDVYRWRRTVTAICIGASSMFASAAGSHTADSRPALGFSLAQPDPDGPSNGPLFQRVKAAFAAANEHGDSAFSRFLAPNAQLVLSSFSAGARQTAPFTPDVIRAATKSCVGPWEYNENTSWVQLSWICRTDAATPLSAFLRFQQSPELSLTVWFEGDRIKSIEAMEPLPIPGQRRVAMASFCNMIARGTPFPYPNQCPQKAEAGK